MATIPSKRLRFRIFPEDEQCIEEALEKTSHTSMSDVIRAALVFLDQAWAGRNSGFRVMFRNPSTGFMLGALDAIAPRVPKRARGVSVSEGNSGAKNSIEIRVARGDEERIHRLIQSGAADTFSELIRRALRLYMTAVQRRMAGDEVVSISPSGDFFPVSVPGAGVSAYPIPGDQPRIAPIPPATPATLLNQLPRTLAEDVIRLAAEEQCSPDLLVVDLIRTEVFARLHPETRRADVASEPAAPAVSGPDLQEEAVRATAQTLENMADNIGKIMQIIGETARRKDAQAQFMDLLFTAESTDTPPAEDLSDIECLSKRAQELNERLSALLSLMQREPRRRSNRVATDSPKDNLMPPSTTEPGPA